MEIELFTELQCPPGMNVGGRIPYEPMLESMRLFAGRVAPRLT